MEVKIGITNAPRELTLESSQSPEQIQKAVGEALAADDSLFVLSDDKGKTVFVPTDKLAYVEVAGASARRLGFGPS